ncbi:MAG TPA: hypothetical protein VOA87_03095, partial [Thermoanaerobaculia bacterium]|nr:hypothetical protein [Thermoanaerobaculia bacterium]
VNGCIPNGRGPVTGAIDLVATDGTVTPVFFDQNGRFCADLRRNAFYVLQKNDYVDCSNRVVRCRTSLQVSDPNAAGLCSGDETGCQDLGALDFFCGGS